MSGPSSLISDSKATVSSSEIKADVRQAINVGLIGVGGFGSTHLSHLKALQDQGLTRLIAVAEPSEKALATRSSSLFEMGSKCYLSYEQMLDAEQNLQAVFIATPIPLHYEMAAACLQKELFVYLEKPPVVLIQQLEELISCDPMNRVFVGFQHIDSEQVQLVKRWILSGKLGRIKRIQVSACWPRLSQYYRRSWAGKMMWEGRPAFDGPATNALSHLLHSVMFLAGVEQAEFGIPTSVLGEFYRARPLDGYDLACLRGEFKSGVKFLATLAHATEKERPFHMTIEGSLDWARISEDGLVESGRGGIHKPRQNAILSACRTSCHNFISFAGGYRPRASTRLGDTRGYVLATHGGLVSSGGVNTLDPLFVREYEKDGDSGYDVIDLLGWIEIAHEAGLLFGEIGAPWACKAQRIDLAGLSSLPFPGYVG
jgi:predicted dehydrogenase